MNYDIKSKPTVYNNTKYRSRLEARWAAMFDLIGWRFQYEPFDLPGWTPDFQVFGSEGRHILFEVKPFIDNEILKTYRNKVFASGFRGNAVLLSNDFKDCPHYSGVLAGYQIMCTYMKEHNYVFDPFEVHWKDGQSGINSEYDIGSAYMWFDGNALGQR